MRSATLRTGRTGRALATSMLCAWALAACSDQQPVAVRQQEPAQPSTLVQAFDCTASIAEGLSCRPAGTGAGGASRAIIDGNNVYIKLASSNASYDAGTETFSVDVTVQNLMNEAMGTPDGATADPGGIQVFFVNGITWAGTGPVTVANGDGTGFFTGADQVFHRYPYILDKDEVSPSKTWQFNMPATVTSFSFRVLIETDMQYLLVINEVLVNPGGTITDAAGEWFEVYNAGSRPVQMQGLFIADSAVIGGRQAYHEIASSLLVQPGAYVVLGKSTDSGTNGGVPVDYAYGGAMSWTNSIDALKISRVAGTDTLTLDRTQYASAATSAQNGISRELRNPALDNSDMDGSNWAYASVVAVYGPGGRGTPKAQNSTFTP
jgi:hypothetical protein